MNWQEILALLAGMLEAVPGVNGIVNSHSSTVKAVTNNAVATGAITNEVAAAINTVANAVATADPKASAAVSSVEKVTGQVNVDVQEAAVGISAIGQTLAAVPIPPSLP
jgi:hypothetical protein